MTLCLRLLLGVCPLLVLGFGEGAQRLEGRLGGSVELPCDRRPLQHPIEKLLVYWQRNLHGAVIVVAALEWGKENPDSQHKKYTGRGSFRPAGVRDGDFTLQLRALRLEDSGEFQCLVIWNPSSFHPPKTTNIILQVTAEFSTPVIVSDVPEEVNYGQELTLTCSTHGGIQEPQVRWVNSSDGTPILQSHIQTSSHQSGDAINLTSTISINLTSSINVSCTILTPSANLSSSPYALVVVSGNTQTDSRHGASSALQVSLPVVSIITLVGILAVVVVLKGRVGSLWGRPQEAIYQSGKAEITTSSV